MKFHSSRPGNSIPESEITPEDQYFSRKRRNLLKGGLYGLFALSASGNPLAAATEYTFSKNSKYAANGKLEITEEKLFTGYNNFYEFSFDKSEVSERIDKFKIDPWKIEVGGLVDNPQTFDVDDLKKNFSIEQRIYRLRCVEKWAAVIPWEGFSLNQLIKKVSPKSSAKFVKFTSFYRPEEAPGQQLRSYPWPYTEGLRMDEAMHDLTLLTLGAYGKPLKKQNGAPVRMVVPWKYGFKSIKSIEKIEFTDTMPNTLWNTINPAEYGFYSNVNPEVSHPRWSQKVEKPLGSIFSSNPTQKFNGYSEVAKLYEGMNLKKFY